MVGALRAMILNFEFDKENMYAFLPGLAGQFLQMNTEQITRIAIFVVILLVVWFIMRAILRFTLRFFAFGCGAIVVLGLVLVLMRIFER